MGGFLQALGQAYGRNVEWQKQDAMDQADIQLKQQAVQSNQLAMDTQKQQNILRQQIGQQIADEQGQEQSKAVDPMKQAGFFRAAAAKFDAVGDYDAAGRMSKQADELVTQSKEAVAEEAKRVQANKEGLSSAATSFTEAPTVENGSALAKAAVAAGINPVDIPAPNTPEFKTWAKAQTTASMTGKDRTEFLQKEKDLTEKRAAEAERHQEHERDVALQRQALALQREQTNSLRRSELASREEARAARASTAPAVKAVEDRQYEWDPEMKVKGARLKNDPRWADIGPLKTSTGQSNTTNAIVASSAEAARGIELIAQMRPDQTTGAFAGIHQAGGVASSLAKVGTNQVTPGSQQIYQTASAGLGLEIGRVLTLGGGRGVNQAQIAEFQNMIQSQPGDTEFESMFRLSNAASIVLNRLSTTPRSGDATVQKQREETEAALKKLPTPGQILAMSNDPHITEKMLTTSHSMQGTFKSLEKNAVTEPQIQSTMRINKMSREQVIEKLKEKGYYFGEGQ